MFMPRQLSHSIEQIARQAVGKDWQLYTALLDHWQEIVGAEYANITSPIKIQFPHQPNEAQRRNGVLTIRLPKGLAMEFTYKTEQIRQRVNDYFGYAAVGKINFDPVFGLPPKTITKAKPSGEVVGAVQRATDSVEDESLRNALQALGIAILTSDGDMVQLDQNMDNVE